MGLSEDVVCSNDLSPTQVREEFAMTNDPASSWRSRISVDPQVCHGRPCIKGTRIWVSLILDFLAEDDSVEELLREYPQLSRPDVMACIAYGAEAARERFLAIDVVNAE